MCTEQEVQGKCWACGAKIGLPFNDVVHCDEAKAQGGRAGDCKGGLTKKTPVRHQNGTCKRCLDGHLDKVTKGDVDKRSILGHTTAWSNTLGQ